MAKIHIPGKTYTLILVEGDTEELFYTRIKNQYFPNCPSKIKNLDGNWDIDKKILVHAESFLEDHPDKNFYICICIDRESRQDKAPIHLDMIQKNLCGYPNIKSKNIMLFEAIQDIECWFFHDMASIYKHLRIKASQRKPKNFIPVEKLNHTHMTKLFKSADKEYRKGFASKHFIDQLDLDIIRSKSKVLRKFCEFMES